MHNISQIYSHHQWQGDQSRQNSQVPIHQSSFNAPSQHFNGLDFWCRQLWPGTGSELQSTDCYKYASNNSCLLLLKSTVVQFSCSKMIFFGLRTQCNPIQSMDESNPCATLIDSTVVDFRFFSPLRNGGAKFVTVRSENRQNLGFLPPRLF